jgi:S-DNA-T family DNA segregation ATPase FtsK/SpoIIIE
MVVPVAVKPAAKAKAPEVEILDIPHEGPEEAVGPETVKPESVTITPTADQKSEPKPEVKTEPKPEPKPERKPPEPLGTSVGKVQVVKLEKIERATASQVLKRRGDYVFPMVSMLNAPAAAGTLVPADFRKRASDLIETLKQFKVDCVPVDAANGIDVGIQQGPSITRYEIKPAPGVRVEKIANLSNNIAMNLEAEAVRILAPVPGKGTVGIEIPNKNRKDVLLREIIESKAWAEAAMELPVVLGVDSVTNKPVIQDLAKMPHALIAGATGQGKSVCINAIIVSLLYRCTPQDLRFIMVDPKDDVDPTAISTILIAEQ